MIKKVAIMLLCCAVLAAAWGFTLTATTDTQRQEQLLLEAHLHLDDKVYVKAAELLEQAVQLNGEHTTQARLLLKGAYQQLGNGKLYLANLEALLNEPGAAPELYRECADYYSSINKYPEAMASLRKGISDTDDPALAEYYEKSRYQYRTSYERYDEVSEIFGGYSKVRREEFWGIGTPAGKQIIPSEYLSISTMSNGTAIACTGTETFAIDSSNRRTALLKREGEPVLADEIGNLSQGRIGIRMGAQWFRCNENLQVGNMAFEDIGTYANGMVPVKLSGKWGLIDIGSNLAVPATFDAIAMDELGRSFAQDALFVQQNGSWYLYTIEGGLQAVAYEDARPFGDGYAAVKQGGKWGFIDHSGQLVLDYQWEDAYSFGMHLAAVKIGDQWGYINQAGDIAIEPVFLSAKSFSDWSAPVQTDTGWTFITLLEYKKGGGLLG